MKLNIRYCVSIYSRYAELVDCGSMYKLHILTGLKETLHLLCSRVCVLLFIQRRSLILTAQFFR